MRGLILNRSKYIVEKSKRETRIERFSIVLGILLLIGFITALNAGNIRGTTPAKPISSGSTTIVSPNLDYSEEDQKQNNNESIEDKADETGTIKTTIIQNNIPETYLVTKVVDGDTIYVSGIGTRIRLIGINTPETVSTSKPVQCYGPEASNYLKNLLLGKYVGLESDAASGDEDIYGRPLRYVYYNGENINQKILLEGYGKEASYGSEYKYRAQFVEAENYASSHEVGLWSPATCGGLE